MECDIKLFYFHFVFPFYFIKISIDSAKLFDNSSSILKSFSIIYSRVIHIRIIIRLILLKRFKGLDLTISNVSDLILLAKVLLCPRGHTKENPESNLGIFFLGFCRTTFYQSACKCSRLKQKNQENKGDGKDVWLNLQKKYL